MALSRRERHEFSLRYIRRALETNAGKWNHGGARSLSTLARGSRIFRQFSERGRALIIQYVIVRHGRGDRHVDLFFLQNTGRNIGSASAFAGRRSTIASSRIWLP